MPGSCYVCPYMVLIFSMKCTRRKSSHRFDASLLNVKSVTAWSRLSGNGRNEGIIFLEDLKSAFLVIGGAQRLIQSAAIFIPCNYINSQDIGRNCWRTGSTFFFFFSDCKIQLVLRLDFWSTKSSKESGRVGAEVIIPNSPVAPGGKGGAGGFLPSGRLIFAGRFLTCVPST